MGNQVFLINPDGTTTEVSSDGPIKEVLKSDECYVLVADDIRKVFLWKGVDSNVRSKFIGAKRSQEIRGQVGMHYAVVPQDEGDEDPDFIKLIGGRNEGGRRDWRPQHGRRRYSGRFPPIEGVDVVDCECERKWLNDFCHRTNHPRCFIHLLEPFFPSLTDLHIDMSHHTYIRF